MCGRFTIISEPIVLQEEFNLDGDVCLWQTWAPRYNVAPSQNVPVITHGAMQTFRMMKWGLVPHWKREPGNQPNLINARSETLNEKPTFRLPLEKNQRCLILASGFYEWQIAASGAHPKAPFYFFLKDHKPFAFAGLFNQHLDSNNEIKETCAIITCAPNELIAPIHHRMPVILNPEAGLEWLQLKDTTQILRKLVPFPTKLMDAYPVGQWINNPRSDTPRCVMPLADFI